MALLETIGVILTSQTAGSVAKFLYEKIEGYIREKFANKKAPDEVEKLKAEIEELKNKLEAKEKEEVTESEVEEVRQTISHIEKTETPLPPEVISPDAFRKWSEAGDLNVEDRALIVLRQLHLLLEKAPELVIKDRDRYKIQEMTASIEQKLRNHKRDLFKYEQTPSTKNREMVEETESLLTKNLLMANDILKEY